jgi:L-fucose isomerase-like protein
VLLATLGVLPQYCIQDLHRKTGAYLINAMDDFDSVETGMRMIRTARRMKDSLLLNLARSQPKEVSVPHLGTRVRTLLLERFYAEFREMKTTAEVKELARAYMKNAKERVEPTEADVVEAAKAYFAFKRIAQAERADAIMMDCLPGLKKPHKHVPPCMGFMSLRDEGIPAGCQSDLNGTLTMMLVQELFGKPGFQQNSSVQTEENHFFGAHCTSPSKMSGTDGPAEPYILRSHNEAGWGCVPQVLFPAGQPLTMALYHSGKTPRMLIYSGEVVRCYPKAPGGCRTNVEMTINELDNACDVKGEGHEHLIIFYGSHARQLRTFCRLYGIEAVC